LYCIDSQTVKWSYISAFISPSFFYVLVGFIGVCYKISTLANANNSGLISRYLKTFE